VGREVGVELLLDAGDVFGSVKVYNSGYENRTGTKSASLIRNVPTDTDSDVISTRYATLVTMTAARPETMFAWRKHKGNPEPVRLRECNTRRTGGLTGWQVWEEVPVPKATGTDALIKILASGGRCSPPPGLDLKHR
jgi:hypothetical protein